MPRGDRFVTPDVRDQIKLIRAFLNGTTVENGKSIGSARVGVYAFFDFEGAAIYVGQSREQVGGRIGRHLTGRRSDAVAMKVLDPMEVAEIEVWPFWDLQTKPGDIAKKEWDDRTKATLDAAEYTVYTELQARHGNISDILNEKIPPTTAAIDMPKSYRGKIVPEASSARLYHPDERIARRASTIAALASIVKERDVSMGLRKTLVTQAERLQRLATRRYAEVAGEIPAAELAHETTGVDDEEDATDDGGDE